MILWEGAGATEEGRMASEAPVMFWHNQNSPGANEGAPAGRVGLGKSRGKKILNLQGCPLMLSLPVVATSQIPKGLLQRPIEAGTTTGPLRCHAHSSRPEVSRV